MAAESDPDQRQQLFDSLLEKLYAQGTALEVASFVEIDAVIEPADSRRNILAALHAARGKKRSRGRNFVDVW